MFAEGPKAARRSVPSCPTVRAGRELVLATLVLGLFVSPVLSRGAEANRTENPHGDFNEDCGRCHQAEAWSPLRADLEFDHAGTGFALLGAHERALCRACHQSLDFTSTRSACAACHQDVHNSELGVDCGQCHTTRSFIDRGQMRRAHLLTRFPLGGAHAAADCDACHESSSPGQLVYVGRSTDCVACHLADYRATTDPDHRALGFSTDCRLCHADISWPHLRTGDGFDHAATGFPLTGAHRRLRCQQCHQGGVFAGTRPDCVACHQADYDQTQNPDHVAGGFSTDCAACHRSSGWTPADFDHDGFFPLRGPHGDRECADCHMVPGDNSQFSCIDGCHHERTRTDNQHDQVDGYTYESQACLNCHPRGRH